MFAVCALLAMLVPAQAPEGALFPVVSGQKWGFIDARGEVVIAPQFEAAREFRGSLAPAMKGSRWGFVNRSGAWVVPPSYSNVGDFREGLAAVVQGEQVGFVNTSGQVAIRPILPWPVADPPYIPSFSEGLAGVVVEAGDQRFAWGYIDKAGNRAFDGTFTYGGEFSEGLAAVAVGPESWGYVDRTGKIVIEPKFSYAGTFQNGLAPVVVASKFGYIDKTGTLVIPNRYSDALEFSEGFALVLEGEKYKVIDTQGKQAFAKSFAEVDPLALELFRFSEGMLVFVEESADGEYLWGYVDRTGRVAIPAKFQYAGRFHGGLAAVTVRRGDDYLDGYIDRTGRYVWQPSK